MKTLILAIMLLMFPVFCFAAPFLVCDPQAKVEKYILEINGVETPEFNARPDGSVRYDLVGLAEGPFMIRAKAGNVWGWSDWSAPFSDAKAVPGGPSGLRVSSE